MRFAIWYFKERIMERLMNLKFFIVDDDPFSRSFYQQHLVNLGFKNNVLFDNGHDCIEKLNLLPDIIFLDYDMQPINGIEVLQKVKQHHPHIHLLIISSQKNKEIISEAKKLGAYDYIQKGENDLELISNVLLKIASGGKAPYAAFE